MRLMIPVYDIGILINFFIITIFVIVIIFALLRFHARHPDNIYFIVSREWQTLIGALIGFLSISAVWALTESYQTRKELERSSRLKLAFTQIFATEIENLIYIVDTKIYVLEIDYPNYTRENCVAYVNIFENFPSPYFSAEYNRREYYTTVDPSFLITLEDVIKWKRTYETISQSEKIESCLNGTGAVWMKGNLENYIEIRNHLSQKLVTVRTYENP